MADRRRFHLINLLKLFLELFKLLPQAFYFRGQRLNLRFEFLNSFAIARSTRGPRTGLFFGKLLDIQFTREQMRKASLLLTWLTRQFHYHWVSIFGAQCMQSFID